jgi:hypothetical protein
VGFLKRDSGGGTSAPAKDPVALALDQLRHAKADPTAPHPTRHFIYVPGVKAAHQVAQLLQTPGREVEIDTSAQQGYWLVVIRQSLVITSESMEALRREFEGAAHPLGGHYDRWQVDIAGA